MAKEKKEQKEAAQQTQTATESVAEGTRQGNMMTDTAIENALAEIEKEKDDKKKREAKRALCIATYCNRKTLLQLQQRRREDDITKEKLNGTKELMERLLGFKTEIKDGALVPTKEKIDPKERLTPTEFESETSKLNTEIRKKIDESNTIYRKAENELRNSYEGDYRYWIRDYWD